MSYAGAYTLDLYCENMGQNWGRDGVHDFNEFPHQFVANERVDAFRAARKRGWVIKRNGACYCPKCNKEKGHTPQ